MFTIGGTSNRGFYPYEPTGSLRFEDGDSPYLERTPATAGTRSTWTFSAWVKRGNLGEQDIFGAGTASDGFIKFRSDNVLQFGSYVSGYVFDLRSNAVYRDTSAWMHIVAVFDAGNATSTLRQRIFVNGAEVSYGTQSNTTSNTAVNNNVVHYIGHVGSSGSSQYYDGYMAEVYFIDGQALDPTYFAETKSGVWVPKDAKGSLTFGTNGFYLPFDDSSAIGDDESGNANDFTTSGLAATDVVPDSPTNNFAVFNVVSGPNFYGTAGTYSQGNLHMRANNSVSSLIGADSTIAVSSGKWYWEIRAGSNGSSFYPGIGIRSLSGGGSIVHYRTQTQAYINGTPTGQTLSTYTGGDIIGLELDLDSATNTLQFYKNGVANGNTFSLTSGHEWVSLTGNRYNSSTSANFGADSSFFGQETAQGNTDNNGFGDFYYSPGTFLALCTANLPEPDISPANGEEPEDYFNTVIYTGASPSDKAVTGVGFQPDWVWIKARGQTYNHALYDSVRGATKELHSNTTDAEDTDTNGLKSFDSDGFTVGSDGEVGDPTGTRVAWNWLAGGTAVSNTDGSVTSSVSANTKAGFSICKWTGTGSNLTVGHGLGVTPKAYIVKRIDGTSSWHMYHDSLGAGKGIQLNSTGDQITLSTYWNSTAPTSSVFSIGTYSNVNTSSANYIAYVFAEVEGYSKIGSYTGVSDLFVHCGFRPAFLMVKKTSGTGSWTMLDAARSPENIVDERLDANLSNAESDADRVDFLSNGFKIPGVPGGFNDAGGSFIFIAFAEMPFKYAQAR